MDIHRFHAASVSAFCSLMLGSAFLSTPPGVRLAGVLAGQVPAKAADEVRALPEAGWEAVSEVQVANALAELPQAAAQAAPVAANAAQPLAAVRDSLLKDGGEGEFNGVLSTLLGLTENNERLPIKQKKAEVGDTVKIANVSLKTKEDLILGHRAKDNSVAYLYRTDSTGTLIKAIVYRKGQGGEELPADQAKAGFEKEAGYWSQRLSSSDDVASHP